MKHDELEGLVEGEGKDLLRQLLEDHLQLRKEREPRRESVTGGDGVERREVRDRERHLMTLMGWVEVGRKSYGTEGASSLMPLDSELNLPGDGFSFGVRKRVARLAAKMSFADVVEESCDTTGAHIALRQAEQLAARAAVDFDAFYAFKQQDAAGPPPTSPLSPTHLVLSTDAKGVVMRKESLRPATRKRASDDVTRRLERTLSKAGKKPKRANHKRMAQVAAVYEVAPFIRRPVDVVMDFKRIPEERRSQRAPRPTDKRVWASVEKDESRVIAEMFAEGLKRNPAKDRPWVILVDGADSQLSAVKRCAKELDVDVVIILDIIHALQRVWAAGNAVCCGSDDNVEEWVLERLERLLEGKAATVAAGIRRSATRRELDGKARKAVDDCCDYLLKYQEHFRYDEYLAAGMPIATGVIEGTCRNLINDRLDITGARWGLSGAEAVLRLRSLKKSADFEAYWTFHMEQEQLRNHLANYAEDEPAAYSVAGAKLEVIRGGRA
jgi:hypothetical protein